MKWKRISYSAFCLCNPHVMGILTWYLRTDLSSSKNNLKCTNSPGTTDTERLFLPALFMLYVGRDTFWGVQSTSYSQRFSGKWAFSAVPKAKLRRRQHFCCISLFSARFTASGWGLFSNWQSQLKYHQNPDIHFCFYLPIHS